MIFGRRAIFYGGSRRLIKWLRDDLIAPLSAPEAPPTTDALLLETNDYLLLEGGDKILLE